MSRHLS